MGWPATGPASSGLETACVINQRRSLAMLRRADGSHAKITKITKDTKSQTSFSSPPFNRIRGWRRTGTPRRAQRSEHDVGWPATGPASSGLETACVINQRRSLATLRRADGSHAKFTKITKDTKSRTRFSSPPFNRIRGWRRTGTPRRAQRSEHDVGWPATGPASSGLETACVINQRRSLATLRRADGSTASMAAWVRATDSLDV